jgi:hypothetical protein
MKFLYVFFTITSVAGTKFGSYILVSYSCLLTEFQTRTDYYNCSSFCRLLHFSKLGIINARKQKEI